MARVELVLTDQKVHDSGETIFIAADQTNGHFFKNNGFVRLVMKSGIASAGTVTIKSRTDSNRRKGDITQAIAASKVYGTSFFEVMLFNNGGNVDVDVSDDTALELAAIRQAV